MDKLYKLAGAAGGAFTCYGARFGVRVNDLALLDLVSQALSPVACPTTDLRLDMIYSLLSPTRTDNLRLRKFHLLYENARLIQRGAQSTDLHEAFENAVNLHVSQRARPHVFVHAGVVAWKGVAIVIPGPSQSGKSTLVSAFLRAGATYLSDEFAVFDTKGKVHPYPRPLSLRSGTGNKTRLIPECFGAETSKCPLVVGMVIATHYRQSSRWKPRVLSRGQAMLTLLANGMSTRNRPKSNFRILSGAIEPASLLYGARGDADETVNTILNRFENYGHSSM